MRYEIRKFLPTLNLHLVIAKCDKFGLAKRIAKFEALPDSYTCIYDTWHDRIVEEFHVQGNMKVLEF